MCDGTPFISETISPRAGSNSVCYTSGPALKPLNYRGPYKVIRKKNTLKTYRYIINEPSQGVFFFFLVVLVAVYCYVLLFYCNIALERKCLI